MADFERGEGRPPESLKPQSTDPHEADPRQEREEARQFAQPPYEQQGLHEGSHEELVQAFRTLIQQDIQQHKREFGDKVARYPAIIISDELSHQEADHMLGTVLARQRSAFYTPINRAWSVIAYEHFRYNYRGQEYEDSLPRHLAGEGVSYTYQRAVALGEPRPEFIKLDPQQVKILDALAEAADISHPRGQPEIEIPENLRYYVRHRFGPDGTLI